MTDGDRSTIRRAVALHLQELARDGVWGLPTGTPTREEVAGHARVPDSPEARRDPEGDGSGDSAESAPAGSAEGRGGARPAKQDGARGAPSEPPEKEIRQAGPSGTTSPVRYEPDLFEAGSTSAESRDEPLDEIRPEVEGCTLCRLCESRTHAVFGCGDPDADLMFIGEGPGRDEDLQGEPFVGKAGGLLDKIIAAMDRRRQDVYITNTVKCRPPGNRNPRDDELAACRPYLLRQVASIQPRVIVLLGKVAVQSVLGLDGPLSRLRGQFHRWQGIDVMCTYHPAYLLRTPSAKRLVWEDVQQVMRRLAGEE